MCTGANIWELQAKKGECKKGGDFIKNGSMQVPMLYNIIYNYINHTIKTVQNMRIYDEKIDMRFLKTFN